MNAKVIVLLMFLGPIAQASTVELAVTGTPRAAQPVRDGERWWGLFVYGSRTSELRSVTTRVEDRGSGRRVFVEDVLQPMFLLRSDSRSFRGGRIPTFYHSGGDWASQIVGERRLEGRDGKSYVIAVQPAPSALRRDGVSQLLLLLDGKNASVLDQSDAEDARYALEWAGDLDGDGRPDLIVEKTTSAGRSLLLFLSSESRGEYRPAGDQDLASND